MPCLAFFCCFCCVLGEVECFSWSAMRSKWVLVSVWPAEQTRDADVHFMIATKT